MKLQLNDTVLVIAGKDKGKKGKITQTLPKKDAIIVEGANKYKRHMKKQSDKNPGGIIEIERPLAVSKVQLICPTCKKPTRIGYQVTSGEKRRTCKKCQATITNKKKTN